MRKLFTIFMTLVMIVVLVGCGNKKPSLSFEEVDYSISVGDQVALNPVIKNLEGTDLVSYVSSDESVAVVTSGILNGVSEGTAVITATLRDHVDKSVELNITVSAVPVANVTFTNSVTNILPGQTTQFEFVVAPENATVKEGVWSSSNEEVATVDQTGLVTGIKMGTTIIKVTVGGVIAEVTVSVSKLNVSSVEIKGEEQVRKGSTTQLTVEIEPSNASDQKVTWKSNDKDVATIDENGVVTGVALGTAEIVATVDGVKAYFEIEVVRPYVSEITITGEETMSVGATQALEAVALPNDAVKSVEWSSSDESIATVSVAGVVTAKAVGTVIITATAKDGGGTKAEIEITISLPAAESVEVEGAKDVIKKGEELQLTGKVLPALAEQNIVWSSSDDTIATVDQTGKVVAVAAGEVVITAKANDEVYKEITIVVGDYNKRIILVDQAYTTDQEFSKDGVDYLVGVNAFTTIKEAIAAVEEGGRIVVAAGTYADAFTISKNMTIQGPNANINPNTDTRAEEAVITGVITINALTKLTLNGLAFTGDAQIISSADLSNVTFNNLYAYGIEAKTTWSDARNYNLVAFISLVAPTRSNKIVIKNSKFDVKEEVIKIGRTADLTISNNTFNNFERDAVRVEGGMNGGAYTISNNKFLNDQLQGYNGIFFCCYGDDGANMEIYITDNEFKNIGNETATYAAAIASKSYQENGATWEVKGNLFETCTNYMIIRNNATAANHEKYPWTFVATNNKFVGVPTGVYYKCKVTTSDTDVTNPAVAVFDKNLFLDTEGNVVDPSDKLQSVKSNNAFESELEFEMNELGIEDEIKYVVNGAWEGKEIGSEVEFAGIKFEFRTTAFATIQEAVSAAQEGEAIYVFPGTYTGDININKNNLKIYGANPGLDPNVDERGPESILQEVNVMVAAQTNGLRLQGLKFTGKARVNVQAGNITNVYIKNCHFETSIASGRDGVIIGNSFDGSAEAGQGNADFVILNNRIESSNSSRLVSFNEMNNLTIEENYLSTPATQYNDLIKAERSSGIYIIKNNTLNGCSQDGIFLGINSNAITRAEIINNVFNNTGNMVDYGNAIDIRYSSVADAEYIIQYNTFTNIPADQNMISFNRSTAAYKLDINYNKFVGTPKNYLLLNAGEQATANLEDNYFEAADYASKVSSVVITNVYNTADEVKEYPYAPNIKLKEITITSDPGQLAQLEQYQIEYTLAPANATNKKVKFSVSDENLATISESGVLTALRPGVVTVYVNSLEDSSIEATVEIEIKSKKRIDVSIIGETVIEKGKTATLETTIVSGSSDDEIIWTSLDEKVATVDETGAVTAVGAGDVVITGVLNNDPTVKIELEFSVVDSIAALDEILQKFVQYHNSKVLYQKVTSTGYQFVYDVVTYGSVSLFDFESLDIDETYMIKTIGGNRPGTKKTSVQYITVHDTASSAASGTAKAHASYVQGGGGGTSWSYSVGNDGIYHQMPDDEVSYHAGDTPSLTDGSGRKANREFALEDTGIKAPEGVTGDVLDAVVTFDKDGYFMINGQSTKLRPYKWDLATNVESLDMTIYTNDQLNTESVLVTVGENGNYYMGKTWYSSSYGYVANYGGNLNSIGMETMVNQGSNLELTWHRAAKLSAHLCIENNLPTSRVHGHHYFSGKNCPQTMRENSLFDRFFEMVEAEYDIQKNYSDYTIKFESHNPDILDNKGMIIKAPAQTTTVSYTITVTKGADSKSITLHSIVDGTLVTPHYNYKSLY